jgi:hypothetical protein
LHLKAIAAGFVAALTLTGSAMAATHRAPSSIRVVTHKHVTVTIQHSGSANGVVAGGFLNAAVAYLQIDRATLVADLKAGQSLAQIATAKGKTADGLVTALLAPAKLRLDAAVAAGKLTADRESTILSRLQTVLNTVVDKSVTPAHTKHVRVDPAVILNATTSYLGLKLRDLVTQLRSGKTIAQVAVAQGKTADGLTAAVVAAVKSKLDAQVSSGRITQQQETDFLAQLQANVAAFVTGSHS